MLLVILGFALSGYLLPWDQKAYWATTVTINVARSTPLVGEYIASLMRGGPDLGALTLGRWFSAHVFLLPMTLVTLIAAHIALMRKHGISGPLEREPGAGAAFFPVARGQGHVMMAAVFASLFAVAALVRRRSMQIANPTDANYIPRPEWYFLSLFQLLKYLPGPARPIATMVVPGVVVGFLFLLPFLDRGWRSPSVVADRGAAFTAAFGPDWRRCRVLTVSGLARIVRSSRSRMIAAPSLRGDRRWTSVNMASVSRATCPMARGGTVASGLSHIGERAASGDRSGDPSSDRAERV